MRKTAIWIVLVIAAALIQATWLDAIRISGVLPDLVLLLVVYFAIVEGEERAMFTGAVGGVFQDVATDTSLGHHVLCLVLVGYAVGRLSTRLITEHPAVKAGLVFLAAMVYGLLYATVLYFQQPGFRAFYMIGALIIPGAFYTALVTPVIFFFLDRSFRRDVPLQGGLP